METVKLLWLIEMQPLELGMIKELASLIIGMNPLDNEVIWEKLYKQTFWGQNGGPVFFAGLSALDVLTMGY